MNLPNLVINPHTEVSYAQNENKYIQKERYSLRDKI